MNRREFLFLDRKENQLVEIHSEKLVMRFLDARLDQSQSQLLARLHSEFQSSRRLRFLDSRWILGSELLEQLKPLLEEFEKHGGRVEFQ